MRIIIFTEGTILMHKNAVGHSRAEIIEQVRNKDTSVSDYSGYVPIGKAIKKITTWTDQDAEIVYLTSRTDPKEVEDIRRILEKHFPKGILEYRRNGEEYKDVAERISPNVIIEDDCESIGGKEETTYYHIKPELKERIKSILVKEFSGIDDLSDDINSMRSAANYAFIDSQNLYLAIRDLGWELDFTKFRVYLRDKYSVSKAFLFIGYIEGNADLYANLQKAGFVCIFKPTLKYKDGTTKGNCDAELVLWSMVEYKKYDKAVIVSGDGDFHCLVKYLVEDNKLEALIIPDKFKYSALLKFKIFRPYLRFVNDLKNKIQLDKKRPHEDKTS